MKNQIASTTILLSEQNIHDDKIRQKYLKYEINKEMKTLEMKNFEENLTDNKRSKVQLKSRRNLNYIYD